MNEMPIPPLDDRALEALLTGVNHGQSDFEWLVPFVENLGEVASGPAPVLKPALATLLTEGFSTEKGDLSATAASNVTGPAPQAAGLPKWRRKMLISELLAGLATKLAGLGAAAKAAVGLTLAGAGASVTAAGAVGALPAPVQHVVATAVSSATPFSFPDSTNDHANFGTTVSKDATGATDGTPGVDGHVVSDEGKNKPDDHADDNGVHVGANTGAKGLDRANQTPAAGHVPTAVHSHSADDESAVEEQNEAPETEATETDATETEAPETEAPEHSVTSPTEAEHATPAPAATEHGDTSGDHATTPAPPAVSSDSHGEVSGGHH